MTWIRYTRTVGGKKVEYRALLLESTTDLDHLVKCTACNNITRLGLLKKELAASTRTVRIFTLTCSNEFCNRALALLDESDPNQVDWPVPQLNLTRLGQLANPPTIH